MSTKTYHSHRQTHFLSLFDDKNVLPAPQEWPKTKTLQRWLRQKSFRRRFHSLADAIAAKIHVHLLASALSAVGKMTSPPPENQNQNTDTKGENPAILFSRIETIRLALSIHQSVLNRKSKIKNQKSPPPMPTFDQWIAQHPHPEETREQAIASLNDPPQPSSNGN